MVVSLVGEGVQVSLPPVQQIVELLEFFDESVAQGTLNGAGAGRSASGRLKALRNMIETAEDFISTSDEVQACHQLQDVLDRIDGNPRPPDFATGPALEELWAGVVELRGTLGCP